MTSKNVTYCRGKNITHCVMTEMIDLAHEEFKTANVNMFRYLKEEMAIMNE